MNSMLNKITLLLLLAFLNLAASAFEEKGEDFQHVQTKRILLNDPDIMASRLTQIEKTLQDLNGITTQLKLDLVKETSMRAQLQADLTTKTAKITSLQSTVSQLQRTISQAYLKGRGSTYIQWGRKHCSSSEADTIYSGFAAGDMYRRNSAYTGGPANTLCLPNNPELSNKTAPGHSYIGGTEYEDGDFFKKGAEDEDVPCALCESRNATSTLMIPGRHTCYSGWKTEYNGLLAAGAFAHKPSQYICIDSNPEYLQAGALDNNGHLLYGVRTECGPLPCPPYLNGMAINCVVCSK